MHTANLGQDRNNAKGSMTNMPIKERVEVAEWIKKRWCMYYNLNQNISILFVEILKLILKLIWENKSNL